MSPPDTQLPAPRVLTPAERELATRPFGFAAVRLLLLAFGIAWLAGVGWEVYQSAQHVARPEDQPLVQRVFTASLFAILCLTGAAVMPVRREIVRIGLLLVVSGGVVHMLVQGAALAWQAGHDSGWLLATGVVLLRLVLVFVLVNLALWFLRNDVRAWYETLPAWFPRADTVTPYPRPLSPEGRGE